jgi:uncharacterized protein YbaR (Trm112 family)
LFCPNCKAAYQIESDEQGESKQATLF